MLLHPLLGAPSGRVRVVYLRGHRFLLVDFSGLGPLDTHLILDEALVFWSKTDWRGPIVTDITDAAFDEDFGARADELASAPPLPRQRLAIVSRAPVSAMPGQRWFRHRVSAVNWAISGETLPWAA